MKIIIIEDEQAVVRLVSLLLKSNYSHIEIVGVADSVSKGIELIENNDFDLALMDVHINEGTTFDILNNLKEIKFNIVFFTTYDNYALDAFKHNAVDYIMKPIKSGDFKKAIDKVENLLKSNSSSKTLKHPLSKRLLINSSSELHAIRHANIVRLEASDSYTKVYTSEPEQMILSSKTLKEYERMLDSNPAFFRVHRSHIINFEFFMKLSKVHGDIIILTNNVQVPLSPSKKQEFLESIDG